MFNVGRLRKSRELATVQGFPDIPCVESRFVN